MRPRILHLHLPGLLILAGHTLGQSNPTCPLLGPVFPAPQGALDDSSAINDAVARLTDLMENIAQSGTNTTFYVQAFSGTNTLFNYGYVPPTMNDSLTTGNLDENTVFRIGSVSKLITVYTILAEVGMELMSDPITKWVPELAKVAKGQEDPVTRPQWNDITIGQLASHLSGIERNCEDLCGVYSIKTY
ncbi:hypothetical protein G7Z17_g1420 [Cylindrodendrum hubeiense]|uniref:Beta-lactamase-related domain-containing protein n=1 Tax=Cylindrodendrum hubeiense TaxID=595255 RepID=A0A9P5LK51_9HYPO|nr:hypothetical protein G7Z17_g1420 [Cylindrodendrum hubeiense]